MKRGVTVPETSNGRIGFRKRVGEFFKTSGVIFHLLLQAQTLSVNFVHCICLKKVFTLAGKVTNKLAILILLKMAERSEAKSAKRSFPSKS